MPFIEGLEVATGFVLLIAAFAAFCYFVRRK